MSRAPLLALVEVIEHLAALHGEPSVRREDAFVSVLRENVAYLVDDATRERVWKSFLKRFGKSPDRILATPLEAIADAIVDGGMQPKHRAAKVRRAAELARAIGLPALRRAIAEDPRAARRLLRRFPGIGEPGADKILLFAGDHLGSLAPDSNALRVLVRLGWGDEGKDYAATYRASARAVAASLPEDASWLRRAHALLREHGRSICRRTKPECAACPLANGCPSRAMLATRSR